MYKLLFFIPQGVILCTVSPHHNDLGRRFGHRVTTTLQ